MDRLYKAQTRFLFHAHIKIKISAFYEDSIFDELFVVMEDVDKKYNSYQPDSYIDRINKNAGSFVEVDDETVQILRQVTDLSEYFGGAYDITIMPLIRLWGFYKNEQKKVPSIEKIAKVQKLVDYKKIVIENNKVKINEGQEIITGSFIKAYAVDKLIRKMQEIGISDAIINAGGSTIRAINDEAHSSWQVIVRDPDNDEQLFRLNINNQCYSTSSQSKTFISINDKQYGHILNPLTGFPSSNKQIGIISDSCMVGDIVSTGLFNETLIGFSKKIEELSRDYKIEGFMIDEKGKITYSKEFRFN